MSKSASTPGLAFSLRRLMARAAAVAAAALVAVPAAATAATITVNTTADVLATDGQCSIREAIINANNDAATWPDCTAGAGADTINLPAGTIVFSLANPASSPCCADADQLSAFGDLDVISSMTINGHPSGTTIDANTLDRVIDINPDTDGLPETVTPSITVQINAVTFTHGRQNQSGAVRILARATVTMDRCTVSDSNSWADDGGGIYVHDDGALTLTNSTITGNHALLIGAGIVSNGTLQVTGSTITDNDTSIINRGHGVACNDPCTIRNTIIAGNGSPPRADTEGYFTSLGYNIIGKTTDHDGNPITLVTATTGDQFDVGAAAVDLQALASNGGPTQTHALGGSSIAIDKGHSSGLTADQRGEPRPCDLGSVTNAAGGDGADIGAFEVQGACFTNTDPVAVDDPATVEVSSGANPIDVLANDSDADGDSLSVTAVTQGANGAAGNNGTSVSYTPAPGFIGTDTFTYTIGDGNGGSDTATVTVNVVDTTPPDVDGTVAVGSLWPVNHKMVNPGLSVNATDNSGGAVTISVQVFSNEDDSAPGAGNAAPDADDPAPGTLLLRAERSGSGGGRVYLIVITATDGSGNASHDCVTVVVPHNQGPQALAAVLAAAQAAEAYYDANGGAPPPGYVPVGE